MPFKSVFASCRRSDKTTWEPAAAFDLRLKKPSRSCLWPHLVFVISVPVFLKARLSGTLQVVR